MIINSSVCNEGAHAVAYLTKEEKRSHTLCVEVLHLFGKELYERRLGRTNQKVPSHIDAVCVGKDCCQTIEPLYWVLTLHQSRLQIVAWRDDLRKALDELSE